MVAPCKTRVHKEKEKLLGGGSDPLRKCEREMANEESEVMADFEEECFKKAIAGQPLTRKVDRGFVSSVFSVVNKKIFSHWISNKVDLSSASNLQRLQLYFPFLRKATYHEKMFHTIPTQKGADLLELTTEEKIAKERAGAATEMAESIEKTINQALDEPGETTEFLRDVWHAITHLAKFRQQQVINHFITNRRRNRETQPGEIDLTQ
mmetsp:Transcript_31978/g.48950  ORF Transcript_31978/g.48950 Transcript_31978/m.48950 type:complete len:208 (+) Transcript_31978:257-880(+)